MAYIKDEISNMSYKERNGKGRGRLKNFFVVLPHTNRKSPFCIVKSKRRLPVRFAPCTVVFKGFTNNLGSS